MRRRLALLAMLAFTGALAPSAALAADSGPTPLDFTYSPQNPKVGETVTYSVVEAQPADPAVNWTYTWDVNGDGVAGSGDTATTKDWVYDNATTYKVTLFATDGTTTTKVEKNVTVDPPPPPPPPANQPPTASFKVSNTKPQVGQSITVTSTSTDPEGLPLTYLWSADGGDALIASTSSGSTTITFGTAGMWHVTLEVTDSAMQKALRRRTIVVSNAPPLPNVPPNTPSFTFSPGNPKAGDTVTLTGSATDPDGRIESIDWDFNSDGIYDATGATVQRTFQRPGDYTVTVKATDNRGDSKSSFQTIFISDPGSTTGSPPSTGSNPGTSNSGSPPTATTPGGQGQARQMARLLNPFPRIRLSGTVIGSITTIRLLTVKAPKGATVRVRCRGSGCPRSLASSVARDSSRAMRVPRFERRLRAGAKLEIYVTRKNRIGSYTRFTIRRGAAPRRYEGCVRSYPHKPVKCPDPGDG
jgi:PKD domain-containing protein